MLDSDTNAGCRTDVYGNNIHFGNNSVDVMLIDNFLGPSDR